MPFSNSARAPRNQRRAPTVTNPNTAPHSPAATRLQHQARRSTVASLYQGYRRKTLKHNKSVGKLLKRYGASEATAGVVRHPVLSKSDFAKSITGSTGEHKTERATASAAATAKSGHGGGARTLGLTAAAHSLDLPTKAIKTAGEASTVAIPVPGAEELGAGVLAARAARALKLADAASSVPTAAKVGKEVEQATRVEKAVSKAKVVEKAAKPKPPKVTRTIKTPRAHVESAVAKTVGAPGRAKAEADALKTAEGRALATRKVARGALSHPVLGTTAALAATHRAGVPVPGGKQADALITGTTRAILHDPAKTAFTTARALPAAITAPVALGESAIQSAQAGSLGPLKQEAKSQFEGAFFKPGPKRGLAEAMLSGDPSVVEKTVKRKGGAALLLPLPALTKTHAYEVARTGVREAGAAARRKIAEKAPQDSKLSRIRHEPKGINAPEPLTAIAARHEQRKRVSIEKQRKDNPQQVSAHRHEKGVVNPLRKRKAPKDAGKIVQPAVEYGIRDKKTADFVRQHDPVVAHDPQLRAALDLIDKHPDFYKQTYGRKSVDAAVVASRGNPAARAGVGDRARVMAQARTLRAFEDKTKGTHNPALEDPVNMVPTKARSLTDATTRSGAWEDVKGHEATAKGLREKARQETQKAKRKLEPARRKALRAAASEAEVRGGAKVLVSKRDRQILRTVPEYVAAARDLNTASRELQSARIKYGNIARYPSRESGKVVREAVNTLHNAERKVEVARERMQAVKGFVQTKADTEAAKAARGEKASPLARLGRAPKGRLGSLERRAGRTAELKKREQEATQRLADARAAAKEASRQAKEHEAHARDLRGELNRYTRPWQSAESETRLPYDKTMVKEHANAVDAAAKDAGLARAEYTHHASVHHPGVGLEPSSFQTPVSRKEHMRSGEAKLETQGKLDRSLPAFVEGTIHMPRRRQSGKDLMRSIALNEKVSYVWDGKKVENGVVPNAEVYDAITSPKTKENPNGGQFDPKSVARLPLREVKNAEADPFAPGAKDPGQILADMEAGRIRGQEPAVLVHRESLKELKAQQQGPTGVVQKLGHAASIASRSILFTPAWEKAQIVAEGVPILMSHPEIALRPMKTGKMLKDFHDYVKSNPEEAAYLEGTAGAVPSGSRASAIKNPAELHGGYNLSTEAFDKGGKALTRGWGWQALTDLAHLKTIGLFDVARMNEYRRVVALAEADKRFRSFRGGLSGLIKTEQRLSHAFRGKPREEMYNWLSRTPEGRREMERPGGIAEHLDNVVGNWGAFTRFEKDFAPFTIFYPFFRYAIRWPLWTFPREHPLTASIAYFLAQQNSNQIEKILGGRPANVLDYAKPVYTTDQPNPKKPGTYKQAILPGGTRISPGQSPLQGAAATGDLGQLLSAANPAVGTGITLLTGKGPFGTDVKGGRGWAAVDQLVGLTPFARAAPLLGLNPIKTQNLLHAAGIGKGAPPPSLVSRMFQALDPHKTTRSLLAPEIPQSAAKFKQTNELVQALQRVQENSNAEQSKIRSSWSGSTKDLGIRIRQMKLLQAEGSKKIDDIAHELGFGGEDAYRYQQYLHRTYGSPAPSKRLLKRSR